MSNGVPFFLSGNPLRFTDNSGESQIARVAGILQYSDDGGATFVSLASFGTNTLLKQPNSAAASVESGRIQNEWRVNTAGSEESRWRFFAVLGGASNETEVGGYAYNSAAFPIIYLGPIADNNYWRRTSAGTTDFSAGGTAILGLSSTVVTALNGFACNGFAQFTQAGAVANATTITWGAGNCQPVTGAGSVNSITMTGKAAGFHGWIKMAATAVITHNTAGTGATILTSTALSITVPAGGMSYPVYYDGTNVFVNA